MKYKNTKITTMPPKYKRDHGKNGSKTTEVLPVRTGGRVKKAKVVFDPSVNNLPRRRSSARNQPKDERSSPSSSSGNASLSNPARDSAVTLISNSPIPDDNISTNSYNVTENKVVDSKSQPLRGSKKPSQNSTVNSIFSKIKKRRRRRQPQTAMTAVFKEDFQTATMKDVSPSNNEESGRSVIRCQTTKKITTPPSDTCYICGTVIGKKTLVWCNNCSNKVHLTCIKIKFKDFSSLEQNWHCDKCTICTICYESSEMGLLITCSHCVSVYHLKCHIPTVQEKRLNSISSDWKCSRCQTDDYDGNCGNKTEKYINNNSGNTINRKNNNNRNNRKPSSNQLKNLFINDKHEIKIELNSEDEDSDIIMERENAKNVNLCETSRDRKDSKCENTNTSLKYKLISTKIGGTLLNDFTVPDVSHWSCEEVCSYFKRYLPKVVDILRDQQIDGPVLLVLKRSDIIRKLPIKLGLAIHLYNFIEMLQTKRNDPTSAWM